MHSYFSPSAVNTVSVVSIFNRCVNVLRNDKVSRGALGKHGLMPVACPTQLSCKSINTSNLY